MSLQEGMSLRKVLGKWLIQVDTFTDVELEASVPEEVSGEEPEAESRMEEPRIEGSTDGSISRQTSYRETRQPGVQVYMATELQRESQMVEEALSCPDKEHYIGSSDAEGDGFYTLQRCMGSGGAIQKPKVGW